MIATDEINFQHLYLHKDNDNEIYVKDAHNLKQHQIDSLRFLYRQFKKKKLGAVLNFPPGSGKSLVVALFLNAINSLLKERILILCIDDKEINHWKQLFLAWTDFKSDEIAVESSNPRVKKKIFLKKTQDFTSYLRCHWSLVVIKDENMCKALQKFVLEADLKIWITSTDVKKDLTLLLFIYNWMFPKSNVNFNEIILNKSKDKEQYIIMDTLLEDFVIRENKVKVIEDTKNSQTLKMYRDNNQTATRRKNKDVTGAKIKKSKKTINDVTSMKEIHNLPKDISNISNEEIRHKPQPELAVNDFTDNMAITNNSCIQEGDIDIKNNTVHAEINQTQTIKIERNTEESLNFQKAIHDIVVNENKACVVEDSTESLDFGDENKESIDNKNILHIEDKKCNYEDTKHLDINKSHLKDMESVKNDIQMNLDEDITGEKSEKGRNDFDNKLTELEVRTLKKFKGSLLDSIF